MTPDTQPEHYDAIPEAGLTVYVWPKAIVDRRSPPLVGIINKGWDKGIADISVLPAVDGAVEAFDNVFHIGDKRLIDPRGNISSAGTAKGCWEFTPFSQMYIDSITNTEPAEDA